MPSSAAMSSKFVRSKPCAANAAAATRTISRMRFSRLVCTHDLLSGLPEVVSSIDASARGTVGGYRAGRCSHATVPTIEGRHTMTSCIDQQLVLRQLDEKAKATSNPRVRAMLQRVREHAAAE